MEFPGQLTCLRKAKCATYTSDPWSLGQLWNFTFARPNLINRSQFFVDKYQERLYFANGNFKGRQLVNSPFLQVFAQSTVDTVVKNACFVKRIPRRSMAIHSNVTKQASIRLSSGCSSCKASFVTAAWFKDKNAQTAAAIEHSDSANEEILLFFFQLDLTTRIQRALNLDQYELAQQLREKLVEVDQEMARQREAKMGSSSSKDDAQNKAITILRLRNELRKAVEEEDYAGAAGLRDKISKLETESLAATATALAYQNVQYTFRLGQKVKHCKFGYRGVVCGMDPLCCESESWMDAACIEQLSHGKNQPFYQVLVDMREEPTLLIAYVAEESLIAPQEPDLNHFDHPYISLLFYGMDAAGDFIPIKQLREKYNKPRHELPWEEDESNGKNNSL